MTIGLYKITNTVNGKYYIGSSNDIRRRWSVHKSTLNKGIHDNRHLQMSFDKYGIEAFVYEIIKEFPKDTTRNALFTHEQELLDSIDDQEWTDKLYNIRRTVDNRTMSPESYRLISKSLKEKWLDPEFRAYMKQFSQKGKVLSEEHRKKIGASNKGRKNSPEAIERTRQALTGRKTPEERVLKITKALHQTMKGKGVYKTRTGKYFARIYHNKQLIYLGQYETYEEALEARLAGEKKYWSIEDGSDVTIGSTT